MFFGNNLFLICLSVDVISMHSLYWAYAYGIQKALGCAHTVKDEVDALVTAAGDGD